MTARQTTFIGLLAALAIMGGLALYSVGRWFPIPGSKFVVMAPYLGLIMFMALLRLESPWAMTQVSTGLAVLVGAISPLMSVAVFTSGLCSDLTGRLLPVHGRSKMHLCIRAALFPMYSVVMALVVTNYLTRDALFGVIGPIPLVLGALLNYLLGLGGGLIGIKISDRIMVRDVTAETKCGRQAGGEPRASP